MQYLRVMLCFSLDTHNRTLLCKQGHISELVSNTKVYKMVKLQVDSLPLDKQKVLEVFGAWMMSVIYWPTPAEEYRR